MDKNRILSVVFVVVLLITSGLVIQYYWTTDSFSGMKYVPMYVMIYVLIYIISQIARRYFLKRQNWWDWIYYIGLISMMLPIFFISDSNVSMYNTISDYGILFLLVPLIFDLKQIIQKK